MIVPEGRIVDLSLLLTLCAFSIFFIWRAKKGKPTQIQRLPAVDAIEEGVGRAVEMGRPVHFVSAMAELQAFSERTSEKILGYYILGYVSELCASQRAKLYVTESDPLAIGFVRETVRSAYERAGWPEGYREDMIAWYPWTTLAFGLPNWFQEAKPGANFMMGNLAFATVVVAEAGALAGAFQVGYGQTEFLMASCEYVLIADEFYATSAYISKRPVVVGGIAGNDYVKMLLLLLFVISVALLNFGVKDILKWLAL
jgi:hypothetical protein